MIRRVAVCLVVLFLSFTASALNSNERISYQGRLINGTNLVNGIATNIFRLWNSSAGGDILFTQTQTITVVDGLYSATLGDDLIFPRLETVLTNPIVYLEVEMNGTTLAPRERIYQAAYALTAVRKNGDTMTGPLKINVGANSNLVIDSAGADIAIGGQAVAESSSAAVGFGANGYDHSAALGFQANGAAYGVAIGNSANGSDNGAAAGSQADGTEMGAAYGFSSDASQTGAAVGAYAEGFDNGVAAGHFANGSSYGVAVGYKANGSGTNIAIGPGAQIFSGTRRIAIGAYITNQLDNTALIRGSLYLDGSTGIYYRPVTGSGVWLPFSSSPTNYVSKIGDTMTGQLIIRAGAMEHIYIGGAGNGIVIGNGSTVDVNSVTIGNSASAVSFSAVLGRSARADGFGVGVGANSVGNINGAAIGYEANGANSGVAAGYQANAQNFGVAIGYTVNGYDHSVAVGNAAQSTNFGTSVGNNAGGRNYGAALGASASGYDYGAAVGNGAQGTTYGAAVGQGASAGSYGVAVGASSVGYNSGVAVGQKANGAQQGNIAVGVGANAGLGWHTMALGEAVTNDVYDSARLRGTLYLDGATTIMYRTTFGSGAWSNMLGLSEVDPIWKAASNAIQQQLNTKLATNIWATAGSTTNSLRKTGDTMTGTLSIQTNLSISCNYDRGTGPYNILSISGGGNVEIGGSANGYLNGVAVGGSANAYNQGVAVGLSANGMGGVAAGYYANGFQGVALGFNAFAGGINRTAIGTSVSNAVDDTALIRGTLYLDGATGIMRRTTFKTGNWTNFPEYILVQVVTNIVKQQSGTGAVTNFVPQYGTIKALR